MKTAIIAAAVVAATGFAAPAFAWEGKVIACYNKAWVEPTYEYHKKLIKPAKTVWEKSHGQLKKVYYPPVYEQIKTKTSDGYYLAVEGKCKH